jgi:(p)ppGpp synthase/HD superfamily hydrolase
VLGPREETLFDLAQDAGKGAGLFPALGHLRLPHHHRDRGGLLPRAGRSTSAGARAGRFKDYISQPKSNGYRSIHTTVSGRDGKRVEVQIRTRQMHEVAEAGVAAHWSYRDGVRAENPFAVDPAKWIAPDERFEKGRGPRRVSRAREARDVFRQVFCFTPKGDVVKLPRGATPIDFAYAIHTRIGHACVGAKIDGMRVPLWTRLKNGQSVEIITAEGQTPQATWLDIAVHRQGQGRDPAQRCARRTANATSSWGANWPAWPSSMSARRPPTRR